MSLVNTFLYFVAAGYSAFLMFLVLRNIISQISFENANHANHDSGEALARTAMFVGGVFVFLVSFAYMIPIKDLILRSFQQTTEPSLISIIISLLCGGGGIASSLFLLKQLDKKDDNAIRMLLFFIGMLVCGVLYSYTIAFERDTPDGQLNTAFLPSISFIIGSMLYLGVKYKRVPPTQSDAHEMQDFYVKTALVQEGEIFTDPRTGLTYNLTRVASSSSNSHKEINAFAYLTVPEDARMNRRATSFKDGDKVEFSSQNLMYHFIVERINQESKAVDIRIVQIPSKKRKGTLSWLLEPRYPLNTIAL
jgi:hypothetical protein